MGVRAEAVNLVGCSERERDTEKKNVHSLSLYFESSISFDQTDLMFMISSML